MLLAAVSNIHNQPRVGGGANQGWNINGPYWGEANNSNQDILSIFGLHIRQASVKAS